MLTRMISSFILTPVIQAKKNNEHTLMLNNMIYIKKI